MSLISPDTKKKKIALPSVLSNIRNAVGRAGAEEKGGKSEVEIRPLLGSTLNNRSSNDLVGVGKSSSSYAADRSQMRDRSTAPSAPLSAASPLFGLGQSIRQTLPTRNVSSASVNNWSATLQTYSERIGSQWRKRNRPHSNNEKRRHRGVTINTQPILIVLTSFFIGVPILITVFLLARKAVFGDEGVDNVAKHEVPAHEVLNYGIDAEGVSPVVGEEAKEITAAQVWNDLKQLTSEDNPLGADGSDDVDATNAKGGSVNDEDVNETVVTNEAISMTLGEQKVTNEVTAETKAMDNTSNLRGSKADAASSQDVVQQGSLDSIDKGGALNSNVGSENQSAQSLESEEKTIVDSIVEKVTADTVSMADEKGIKSNSTDVDIVVEEVEKSVTNNQVVGKIKDAEN